METDIEILQRIGGFIRKERLRQNLTQSELAAHAGIGRSTLSLLERGEAIMLPSLLHMYKAEMKQRRRARKSAETDSTHLAAEPEW